MFYSSLSRYSHLLLRESSFQFDNDYLITPSYRYVGFTLSELPSLSNDQFPNPLLVRQIDTQQTPPPIDNNHERANEWPNAVNILSSKRRGSACYEIQQRLSRIDIRDRSYCVCSCVKRKLSVDLVTKNDRKNRNRYNRDKRLVFIEVERVVVR